MNENIEAIVIVTFVSAIVGLLLAAVGFTLWVASGYLVTGWLSRIAVTAGLLLILVIVGG